MNAALKDQIAPEIAQALMAQAAANGLSVNEYLCQLLGLNNGAQPATGESVDASMEAFMADMESLSEGTEHLAPSTIAYSREDIYFDHDYSILRAIPLLLP
jgi:hypothetical protein